MSKPSNHQTASHLRRRNRLASEKSPYLLQHAENPVDWFPWTDEAFERARREDKPVFLSIGYSTCHWCHVMAHESFGDEQVASLLNETFVCVKVDREERPDLDDLYMTAAQLMSGRGGWPLTIIMTPDKVPFFAATYIPKHNRFGMAGMMTLIPAIRERWATHRQELLGLAQRLQQGLEDSAELPERDALDSGTLQLGYAQLASRFDAERGGFGPPPQFPTPHNLLFLLRHWNRHGNPESLGMVQKTLTAMRRGGMFDQLGYGFHRYSTDADWLVPHFEKMLYDQALLAIAYTEAFQATGDLEHRSTAKAILTYVLHDMKAPEGGFYSAEDADSEGEEGKFYVWTWSQLRGALSETQAAFMGEVFGVDREGNFADEATGTATGTNILHLDRDPAKVGASLGWDAQKAIRHLENARRELLRRRSERVRPLRDDKILTGWNGLMIAAFGKAAWAFGEPEYAEAASQAVDFLLTRMVDRDGRLLHRFREGEAGIPAFASDYAYVIWGLLELYEATFAAQFIEHALELNKGLLTRFWDASHGGFFTSAHDAESLLVRQKEVYDGAVPSANAVAVWNLLRLARLTGDASLEEAADLTLRAFSGQVSQSPSAHTLWMVALDYALGPSLEVVVAGVEHAPDMAQMLAALRSLYLPNAVILLRPTGAETRIVQLAPYTAEQSPLHGMATAYVCRDHFCQELTTDVGVMLEQLRVSPDSDLSSERSNVTA